MTLPTPITILTGFLGSGKTTLILSLIPQLPPTYKLALLKNEFGDVAIDSQLATSSSISSVRELLNGCICCNLVGQLSTALSQLRALNPDRIVIETSGSAFPATLALEINRLARDTAAYALDGVVNVLDVQNWAGYEDTSVTARMQARFTDLVVFNKWEDVSERRFEDCLDRLGDLEVETPWVKSVRGSVPAEVLLGIDGALARGLGEGAREHAHEDHQSEVDVLSVSLGAPEQHRRRGVDLDALARFLARAPKDEIYRIKAVLLATSAPVGSEEGDSTTDPNEGAKSKETSGSLAPYILNWAFGRWTVTPVGNIPDDAYSLRMTVVCARDEGVKWAKRLEKDALLVLDGGAEHDLIVRRVG